VLHGVEARILLAEKLNQWEALNQFASSGLSANLQNEQVIMIPTLYGVGNGKNEITKY